MSQIAIDVSTEQIRAIDALCAKSGKSRNQLALAALEAALAKPEEKPRFRFQHQPAAAPQKPNAGADKEE